MRRMAVAVDTETPLKTKTKVVATQDLPAVPEGTPGRVLLVNGFTWLRYRVLFENGVDIGTLDRKYLATPIEYQELLRRRESGDLDEVTVDGEATAEAGADTAVAAGGGGDDKVVNGVSVPGHLIERSKNRRQALGA
jgi:hypothetical protein